MKAQQKDMDDKNKMGVGLCEDKPNQGAAAAAEKEEVVVSVLEQRRLKRALENENARRQREQRSPNTEVDYYLEEELEGDAQDFNLLRYWKLAGENVLDSNGTVLRAAKYPILAKLACRVFSVDASSCECERSFSTLKNVLDDLRASMGSTTVEMMLFLRLNRKLIPEVAKMTRFEEEKKAKSDAAAKEVATFQSSRVGKCILV
jgi:hypothetical protein